MTPLEALQAGLAGEHAAVYVYGVVGARVSATRHPVQAGLVSQAYVAHRDRRDQLVAVVHERGTVPVAAEVSYELPTPCRTLAELVAAARTIEARSAEVYADTAGSTSGADRAFAVTALGDAAGRLLDFGAAPTAFPGVPEL